MTGNPAKPALDEIQAEAREIFEVMTAGRSADWLAKPMSRRGAYDTIAHMVATERLMVLAAFKRVGERLAALEAGGIKFAGTWQRSLPYSRGDVTAYAGSAWVALRSTTEGEQPGKTPDAWQLCSKANHRG